MEDGERTSTGIGVVMLDGERVLISAQTVWMVDSREFGSGGVKFFEGEEVSDEVDFEERTTVYPFSARSMAICLPIPRDAPITTATGLASISRCLLELK